MEKSLTKTPKIQLKMPTELIKPQSLKDLGLFLIYITAVLVVIEILFPFFIQSLVNRSIIDIDSKNNQKEMNKRKKAKIFFNVRSFLNKNSKKFKLVITATFSFFWIGLFLYSISFINYKSILDSISSHFTKIFIFKIFGLLACGYSYIIIAIPVFLSSNSLWIFVFLIVLGLIILFTLLGVFNKSNTFVKTIFKQVMPTFSELLARISLEMDEVQKAVIFVNDFILHVPSYLLFPTLIFAIQSILLSNLLLNNKLKLSGAIMLIFLVDWSFNFLVSLTKFNTFLLKDIYNSLNSAKNEQTNISGTTGETLNTLQNNKLQHEKTIEKMKSLVSFKLIFSNIPEICTLSLRMTIFSFLDLFCKIIKLIPYNQTIFVQKISNFFEKIQIYFIIVFQVNEFNVDQELLHLALIESNKVKKTLNFPTEKSSKIDTNPKERQSWENLQDEDNEKLIGESYKEDQSNLNNLAAIKDQIYSENKESLHLIEISKRIFTQKDTVIFSIISMKNLAIKLSLHSTIFIFSILNFDSSNSLSDSISNFEMGNMQFFKFIFQKIDPINIFIFVFCLFITSYFIIVESVYIINKKANIEKEIEMEKNKNKNKERCSFIANHPVIKKVSAAVYKVVDVLHGIFVQPQENSQNVNLQNQEQVVDVLPSILNFDGALPSPKDTQKSDKNKKEKDSKSNQYEYPEPFKRNEDGTYEATFD